MAQIQKPASAAVGADRSPPAPMVQGGSDTALFIFDEDLRYTFIEGLQGEPSGYVREKLLGKTIYETIPPALIPTIERHYRAALRGEVSRFETQFKGLHYHVLVVPIYECGEVSAGMAVAQNVTEQRRLQRALWESERKYRGLVETSHDLLWSLDLEGKLTFVNPAVRHIYGYEPEEVIGRSYLDFVAPESKKQAAQGVADILAGKEVFRYEAIHLRKDGTPIHVLYNGVAARNEAGEVVGTTGTLWDITHIRRAEELLRHAHDELERRVQARTADLERANARLRESEQHYRELLKEIDHRVRNNLSALLGLLSATRRTAAGIDAFAEAIEARLRAMARVHQLLSEENWRPIDLRSLIESLAQVVRELSGGSLCICLEGPNAPIGPEQTLPLSMALLEWFTNSLKHGAHSREEGRIDISWTVEPSDDRNLIRLWWRERGGPQPAVEVRESLGSELVRSFITRELRGRCQMSFPPEGVDHLIEFLAG